MKNKIFLASILVLSFSFTVNADAMGQGSGNKGVVVEDRPSPQGEVVDQVRGNQTNDQVNGKNQVETSTSISQEVPIQVREQEREQERSQDTVRVREQGLEQENLLEAESNQVEKPGLNNQNMIQRRSRVANAVQEMLHVAERNGGLGKQIRTIAQNQNQNQERIEANLERVQSRSRIVRFFIGPDYSEINNADSILRQNREQIEQLNQIKNQFTNQSDQQQLTEQIRVLEQANSQIEESLTSEQRKFSLFGWLFRSFSK